MVLQAHGWQYFEQPSPPPCSEGKTRPRRNSRLERQCWTQAFKFHNLVRPQVVNVICKVINIAIILVGHYPSVSPGHDRMHERDGKSGELLLLALQLWHIDASFACWLGRG
jgi:hypothetical protein